MPEKKQTVVAGPICGQQPAAPNPIEIVPEQIPFDVPYGPPISLERAQAAINTAVAEAKKRNWKMNVAVVDSGGNLVAFQRMELFDDAGWNRCVARRDSTRRAQ